MGAKYGLKPHEIKNMTYAELDCYIGGALEAKEELYEVILAPYTKPKKDKIKMTPEAFYEAKHREWLTTKR